MPWSSTHKTETRQRILEAAASAFRAEGVGAIGVGDVMGRAGLTHGGFYAHFESKEQLVTEALRYASGQTTRTFDRTAASAGDRALEAVIDSYLDPAHLAHPERGCVVASLGPEAARAPRGVKPALSPRQRA